MNRLTYRGKNGKGYVRNQGYYDKVYLNMAEVAERLTAYEDTGLEPEEVLTGVELADICAGMLALAQYQCIGTVEDFRAALRRIAEVDTAREDAMKTAYDENGVPYLVEAEGSEAKHIVELLAAEAQGRMVELPLVAMVERSLQGGKMKPDRDQRFNGRYAVVYSGKGKWGCPLIDICGTPYNSDQAEERKNELTRQEAAAALDGGGEGD